MKLWTNNTNAIHKVDDNMLYPRTTYVLPDELTGPTWDDSIPCPHKIKPYYKGRAAGGATTFNAITICNESVTFDAGNTVVLRECATGESGYHAAIITNRKPMITANPEAKLVATRPTYTNWIERLEANFTSTIASATGDGTFAIGAPKAQIINPQEGERNGLVTDELEFQCNRNGNTEDEELSITFTDDA